MHMKSLEKSVLRQCNNLDLRTVSRYTYQMDQSKSPEMRNSRLRPVVITRINGPIVGHRSSFGVGTQKRLRWILGMVCCGISLTACHLLTQLQKCMASSKPMQIFKMLSICIFRSYLDFFYHPATQFKVHIFRNVNISLH